jgi:hypothetical protein
VKGIVTAKGYKTLMNLEWVVQNIKTPEFQKTTAWAMNKLYELVKSKFHPILADHTNNIYRSIQVLATACGKKLILLLCNKLFNLINLSYNPDTSIAQHLVEFIKNYTSLCLTIASCLVCGFLAKKRAKQTEVKAQERSRVRGSRALWIGFAKNRCGIARGGAQFLSIYN